MVLGEFDYKYTKGIPTKYQGNHTIWRGEINKQLENNAIINKVVNDILLNETQKASAAREAA